MTPSEIENEADEINWPRLLAEFDEKRLAALAAAQDSDGISSMPWRGFWQALGGCLRAGDISLRAKRPLPGEAWHPLAVMEGIASELAAGRVPSAIKEVLGDGGRSAASRTEDSLKRAAVTYVEAAKSGIVDDHAPINTIIRHFRIGRRTVQDWGSSFAVNLDWCDHSRIRRNMTIAASRYRRTGRSREAITVRDARP